MQQLPIPSSIDTSLSPYSKYVLRLARLGGRASLSAIGMPSTSCVESMVSQGIIVKSSAPRLRCSDGPDYCLSDKGRLLLGAIIANCAKDVV